MNRGWWIGAVLLLSAASTIMLPKLADMDSVLQREHGVLETFIGGRDKVLDESNLVDQLGSLPLMLSIDSAGWENNILSLDLKITSNDPDPEAIYKDMSKVISFAFQDTPNVNELLLRVIVEDKWLGSRRLLLAGDIRRTEWSHELQRELDSTGNTPLSDRIKMGFRISESDLWNKQFISP
ncbi:hypothetical protein [Paenibacillus wynnii]|uniref:Uncharacterized protein n=1 Tax=Paenibacillus wynnii TaxID=268407 RepID=A0A098M6Z7_9BACL|nr:hypothetical protein [Paenibacillus wynnii]KGE17826.1 hypothetical protein PWYN_25050 [Paenibacillus wynnii]